jgi:putative Ca2+/H+ antiporter (TMEM165/GDT1 family)
VNVGTFASIAALMFLLELPDKTMIATIVMSTKARPSSIVVGASSAFVAQMGIAVAAGGMLTLLPARPKEFVVALLFLAGAAYLLFVPEKEVEEEGREDAALERAGSRWREVSTAFTVIFIGEFGDLTQIQAANFVARTHQPLEVFLASSIALVTISFVGAYGGRLLQRVVPLAKIRLGGGLIFAGLGVYTLIKAFSA